jgi:protein O-mannosyl-transferase
MTEDPALPLRQRRLIIALLAVVTYACTLRLGFLWDDHVMIEGNNFIRSWSWQNLLHDFTSDAFYGHGDPYYRPAQLLLNRLDYTLWGLRPVGFHFTNLLSHLANGILLHELVLALGFFPLTALLAGALFAVHPIGVEQLMIIAGRAELFGLTFSLASLIWLLRPGWRAAVGCSAFYVIGLFFKESVVVTPVLGALLLYFKGAPLRRYSRLLILVGLTIPYFVLRTKAVGSVPLDVPLPLVPLFFVKVLPELLARYLGLLAVPWNLHSHRAIGNMHMAWPVFLAGWVAVTGYALRARDRRWLLCLGLFVIPFLPKTVVMMSGGFMLDHWAYPAAVGACLALAIFFTFAWESKKRLWRAPAIYACLFLLIFWALLVPLNVQLRGTDEKMYRWALHFTHSNPLKSNLGVLLLSQGRPMEAIVYLHEVFQNYPEHRLNTNALAEAYFVTGRKVLALKLLEQLLLTHPNDPLTRYHLEEIRTSKKKIRSSVERPLK